MTNSELEIAWKEAVVLFLHYSGGTDENHENLSNNSHCPSQDLK
jgi:hypothetical protein